MVKITKESGSTVVEAVEHTLSTTFGIQANTTVTKGYIVSQNSDGNIAHSAENDSIGTVVGVCDATETEGSAAGVKSNPVINHGLVWAMAGVGAIVKSNPLKVSTSVGTLSAATYGVDREDRIIGTAWSASTSG
ncbi:MAG: hypothetical protein Q8M94_07180, partial [Ignavibacteria bacterium]|nr:hypothetical protein [Ignavibacteria bacterium]